MAWTATLGNDLKAEPLGLVALTGLDHVRNAIHKTVWDTFCNNSASDVVSLNFKLFPADHEYPKAKTPRSLYDFYTPKGILRSNWMSKHLNEIPAVIAVFFDLDYDDPSWNERIMECHTKIQIVRSSLQGRHTKICIVLLLNSQPNVFADSAFQARRLNELAEQCDLNVNDIFTVSTSDVIPGYITQIEKNFLDFAKHYYNQYTKRVKEHLPCLNKTNHQYLYVRHNFKMGFYKELEGFPDKAILYYNRAYKNLREVRIHDTNLMELKMIAAFVNYKLCSLQLRSKSPGLAKDQYNQHIEFFKDRLGINDLVFEHYAWLSKQHEIFAELFASAVEKELIRPSNRAHPGYHYLAAAVCAKKRKELCDELTVPSGNVDMAPLKDLDNLEFFGQRPWRQGHTSISPPDEELEKAGILCLQYLEKTMVNHSAEIISLLSKAVHHFKLWNSERTVLWLNIQIGEVYYGAGEYEKALESLKSLSLYRRECWWPLLYSSLSLALKCSYIIADIPSYISISFELLNEHLSACLSSSNERERIQLNLSRVLDGKIPEPEPGIIETERKHIDPSVIQSNWYGVVSEDATVSRHMRPREPLTINMHSQLTFLDCNCEFGKDCYQLDELCSLKVDLNSNAPFPITFSRLEIQFFRSEINPPCIFNGTDHLQDIRLHHGLTWSHTFTFVLSKENLNDYIKIQRLILTHGDMNRNEEKISTVSLKQPVQFNWPYGISLQKNRELSARGTSSITQRIPMLLPKGGPTVNVDGGTVNMRIGFRWNSIELLPRCEVLPRASKIKVEASHNLPALLDDDYLIKIKIVNTEDVEIFDIKAVFSINDESLLSSESSHSATENDSTFSAVENRPIHLSSNKLSAGDQITSTFTFHCALLGVRKVKIHTMYKIRAEIFSGKMIECECVNDTFCDVEVVNPFQITQSLLTLSSNVISNDEIREHLPFLLMIQIEGISPHKLQIREIGLNLNEENFSHVTNLSSEITNSPYRRLFERLKNHNEEEKPRKSLEMNSEGENSQKKLLHNNIEQPYSLSFGEKINQVYLLRASMNDWLSNLNLSNDTATSIKCESIGDLIINWNYLRKTCTTAGKFFPAVKKNGTISPDSQLMKNTSDLINEILDSTKFTAKLSGVIIKKACPLFLDIRLPPHPRIYQAEKLTFFIVNQYCNALDLMIIIAIDRMPPNVILSGVMRSRFTLLPGDSHEISYNMIVTTVGPVRLPSFRIEILEGFDEAGSNSNIYISEKKTTEIGGDIIQGNLPKTIFILPSNQKSKHVGTP